MKKLLVITRAPWLLDNGIGSTLWDFFSEFSDFEIYSLCLREAPRVCSLTKKNFYISESQLINGIIKHEKVGKTTDKYDYIEQRLNNEEKIYDFSKKVNLRLFNFLREMLWSSNLWKNNNLDGFLNEIKPDVIFFPDFPCIYAHKVLDYVFLKTNAKIAIFHADDCYTLRQFSLSPLFWIYRFWQRKWVRKSVQKATYHYVISDVQKADYDSCFNVNNKVLTKFSDFSNKPSLKEKYEKPLQLVYTGNIALNRWKSLKVIVDALRRVNENEVLAQLKIYTANSITKRIRRALNVDGSSYLMGKIPASDIGRVQSNADILVHVEAKDIKNRLLVRQSFSTKIVDYLKRGRTILAVGPQEVASIKHLKDNECALVATDEQDVYREIVDIIKNQYKLNEYAIKAFECGFRYHNKEYMLKMLHDDLCN